jgi:hypothetical protein
MSGAGDRGTVRVNFPASARSAGEASPRLAASLLTASGSTID